VFIKWGITWFFCTKYRKNLLKNEILDFLKKVCSEIGERYCFEFDAIGCDGDYIHIFVGFKPNMLFQSNADYKNYNCEKNP
jgi:REP element-mobilizing transposase RayT